MLLVFYAVLTITFALIVDGQPYLGKPKDSVTEGRILPVAESPLGKVQI
jgi:hypothetical protein